MSFLIFAGIVALIFGALYLFSPQTIHNLNRKATITFNKTLFDCDEKLCNLRIGVGVSLILISASTFFTVYYLIRKYG